MDILYQKLLQLLILFEIFLWVVKVFLLMVEVYWLIFQAQLFCLGGLENRCSSFPSSFCTRLFVIANVFAVAWNIDGGDVMANIWSWFLIFSWSLRSGWVMFSSSSFKRLLVLTNLIADRINIDSDITSFLRRDFVFEVLGLVFDLLY